jgi:galactonate dehydratase
MSITELRTAIVGTPWRHLTFVEVHTDEGLVGVGETRMIGHTEALIGYLAEAEVNHIRGADPFDIEALVQRMVRIDYGRSGEVAMSALAVVEMACWDIIGKALGQPVYRLLGGKVLDRIKAYANGWYAVEREPRGLPRGGPARRRARLPRAQARPLRRRPLGARSRGAPALG